MTGRVTVDKGVKDKPIVSHGWFIQCQPQLSYQKGDPTANIKVNCLNKEVITDYFEGCPQLLSLPSRIYNVDETGMALDSHAPKVVAKRGQKKVRYRTSGNKSQITIIVCVSASGQCIPPFVIFDTKRLNMD